MGSRRKSAEESTTQITLRDPEAGVALSPYTKRQKAQAVAAYCITDSCAEAQRVLRGLWGIGVDVPAESTIAAWSRDENIRLDPSALDDIKNFCEARFQWLAFKSYEKAEIALIERDLTVEKLFNVIGNKKIGADVLVMAQKRQPQSNTFNMTSPMFVQGGERPATKWDHEVEVKEIDGNGSGAG